MYPKSLTSVILMCAAMAVAADEPPPSSASLQKARQTYADELLAAKNDIRGRLDELISAARKKGETDTVRKLVEESDRFQREADLPKRLPAADRARYFAAVHRAQVKAIAAFDDASKDLTKAGKDSEAEAVEAAKRTFAKTFEPTLQPLVLKGAYYRLVVRKSELVVVPSNSGTETGAQIIQWQLQNDNDAMLWQFVADGDFHAIVNKKSLKALSVKGASTQNGALIVQQPLAKNNAAQLWKLVGVEPGWCKALNKYSGRALSVHNGSVDPGVHLLQWPDAARADQGQQLQLRLVD